MTHTELATAELLTSFFQRLTEFEGVTRAMLSGAELSAELIFRGQPERRVLLDFTAHPARVLVDDRTRPGQIVMAADAEVMHQILTGQLAAGIAFARRQVLLRGPAGRMARFLPLLGVAPLLYREHLADLGVDGFARPTGWAPLKESLMTKNSPEDQPIRITERSRLEELVYQRLNGAAYAMGYAMGKARRRLLKNLSLFDMMSAMSRGLDAASGKDRAAK